MSMIDLAPIEVSVRCDPFTGRPRSVRVGPDEVPVRAVERVRDESAAYPSGAGPRTLFVVLTPAARLRLAYGHRDRRWLMIGVDPLSGGLARAA
jgi:hypothetical protein